MAHANIFLERYKSLGISIQQLLAITEVRQTIRINTLKVNEKQIIERLRMQGVLLEKVPFLDYGYWVKKAKQSVGAMPEYLFGYYYIQETAAQIPVQILKPAKEDIVLDMSAAPGGKTTQIAQYMENQGILVAMDNNTFRLQSLQNNLERIGISNCLIYNKDGRYVQDIKIAFDKILLDAPCSGNFVVDKEWFNKKTIEGIKERSYLQKEMLAAAVHILKKGGILIYSTCSLEPEENEMVIDWALKNIENIEIQEIDFPIGDKGIQNPFGILLHPDVEKCKRFWPHKTKTQGFFVAKIKKS